MDYVMRRITLKYHLKPFEDTVIPNGIITAVASQNDLPTVWVCHLLNERDDSVDASRKPLIMRAFATGEVIPDGWTHIETVFCGSFVWHVYMKVS